MVTTLLAACGSPNYPPAPATAASPDYRYLIGSLDTVNITVWGNPDLSQLYPCVPTGVSRHRWWKTFRRSAATQSSWHATSRRHWRKYVRDPQVTVIVTSFAGPFGEQIRVVGEAAKPQAIAYRQNMTMLDVMIVVGGLTDFADGNRAVLVRGSEKGKQYSVRLADLVRRGDISANVDVQPGDVLIIPQGWF